MPPPSIQHAFTLALQHHKAGRLQDAEPIYRQILLQQPTHAGALNMLGVLALQTGHDDTAITFARQAIALQPNLAEAHCNLGNALRNQNQLDDAIAAYRQALALKPNLSEASSNLAAVLIAREQLEEAVAACRHAIAHKPNFPQAHNNLGHALKRLGRLDEALAAYRHAIALAPQLPEAHHSLAIALADLGLLDEAIATYRQTIALQPTYPEAHYNLAMLLLLRGDFHAGWPEHEWRWKTRNLRARCRQFPQPQWDGAPLAGRTILVHTEQGLGDALMFCRYLPLLAARGGRILLECPPELHHLLQSSPAFASLTLLTAGQPLPAIDFHCPLLSLPLAFRTTPDSIPHTVPYLQPDPTLVQLWQDKLASIEPRVETRGQRTRDLHPASPPQNSTPLPLTNYQLPPFKVGLVWAGRKEHVNDHNRSLPLAAFAPLAAIPNITFFSLQKGERASEAAHPPAGMHLIDFTPDLHNLVNTAALIANLDLIISVDTAVAHLAGALARPTWVLLPFLPDWRWLLDRNDSPWYPTMRLFRQPNPAAGPAVLPSVAAALTQLASNPR